MAVALMLSRLAICRVELPPYPDSAKASIAARRMRSAAAESAARSMVMTVGILHVFDICLWLAHY
jgi:hypothetical protein